jgi:hypothetical protein
MNFHNIPLVLKVSPVDGLYSTEVIGRSINFYESAEAFVIHFTID